MSVSFYGSYMKFEELPYLIFAFCMPSIKLQVIYYDVKFHLHFNTQLG